MNWHGDSVEDGTSESLDEPLFGVFLCDTLELAESTSSGAALADSLAGAGQHDVEVHAENTSGRVVPDSEIDMLIDTEAEVA